MCVCVCVCVCVYELFNSVYCVSLGSPPRIAMLTAGYKGLSKIVKIKSMLLLLLLFVVVVVVTMFAN